MATEFENTFAPACLNRRLTAVEIVAGMRLGAFRYDELPPEVRRAVDAEVARQERESAGRPPPDMAARGDRMLATVRVLRREIADAGAGAGRAGHGLDADMGPRPVARAEPGIPDIDPRPHVYEPMLDTSLPGTGAPGFTAGI